MDGPVNPLTSAESQDLFPNQIRIFQRTGNLGDNSTPEFLAGS